ncbi:FAD dependent oxidoreductase [Gloeopeniophorella convolvens]|nr:FAD dependent oxidoreductase [Gloeopeniophorella convolvens]
MTGASTSAPSAANRCHRLSCIIGVATAYHLSRLSPGLTIHLIDSSPTLFVSASGRAAGFLARDWFPTATTALGALSFDLHKQLAAEHDGATQWGYSPSTGFSLPYATKQPTDAKRGEDWLLEGTSRATAAADAPAYGATALPTWLAADLQARHASADVLSTGASTAQVNPLQLCEFLLAQCRARGVAVHHPVFATGTVAAPSGALAGVVVRAPGGAARTLPCDALLLTAGVWTPGVFASLFPRARVALPIGHLSGHSVVLRSPRWAPLPGAECHAVFTTIPGAGFTPEVFSRAGGDIYLAGLNTTSTPVPELAAEVQPEPASVETLMRVARKLMGGQELDVVQTGFCHRPVSDTGAPLLTKLTPEQTGAELEGGVWACAGHGPWGISMSLGTGLVLAELVLGKSPSADVSQLSLPS